MHTCLYIHSCFCPLKRLRNKSQPTSNRHLQSSDSSLTFYQGIRTQVSPGLGRLTTFSTHSKDTVCLRYWDCVCNRPRGDPKSNSCSPKMERVSVHQVSYSGPAHK